MSMVTQQQKQYKVLLIGETCQDIYVFGSIDRLSPEAPVPVLKKTSEEIKSGMSRNVYKNILSMSENVSIDIFTNKVENIRKIRYIDTKSNYQIMRCDIENVTRVFCIDELELKNYDAVVISDYNKGFLTNYEISSLCKTFKTKSIFVDTKRKNVACYQNCILKINDKETSEMSGLNDNNEVITTQGPDGCVYRAEHFPVKKVDVHDVCGAGDVFLAALVVRWLETSNMKLSIKTANNCAALSVTKLGCYTIKREEYENLCV